jgi:hypothetical protein
MIGLFPITKHQHTLDMELQTWPCTNDLLDMMSSARSLVTPSVLTSTRETRRAVDSPNDPENHVNQPPENRPTADQRTEYQPKEIVR